VAQHWYGENCVLLGDAAHPTLPFMAQAANMALEDAWVLADCLAVFPARAEALRRYQQKRRERAARVVDAASGNAWKYHLRGPARLLAHAGLRLAGTVAPGRMLHQFDWLYGFDVTR